jgi:FAD/FMN-containing dehydrogenase
MDKDFQSWGGFPKVSQSVKKLNWLSHIELDSLNASVLPRGLGRSYGILLDVTTLKRFISFDEKSGLLRCESGVSFEQIINCFVPRGWFLPVTPGTKYVTVGGAIANDVHGKNHHVAGTFGCHVTKFELLRSNGEKLICSKEENIELFGATIGGLGLTGLITCAEFKLIKVSSPFIEAETIKFPNLREFFELSKSSEKDFKYIVSWVDCLRSDESLGRGLFIRGNFSTTDDIQEFKPQKSRFALPFNAPASLLNSYTVKIFNELYYGKQRTKTVTLKQHLNPFFYPLDALSNWNKMYGSKGFLQYQFVVPLDNGYEVVKSIIQQISKSKMGSFLTVLKTFGDIESPGWLSFPKKGVTLALDFAYTGANVLQLLNQLDKTVASSDGRVYPAKDARMSAENFYKFYPKAAEFENFIDPQFSSSFWRRVSQKSR